MKLFSASRSMQYLPGHGLRLQSRPSILMCLCCGVFSLQTLVCLLRFEWGAALASLVFGMPAFWMGTLAWCDWREAFIPPAGGAIAWQDGLFHASISGDRILAVSVDVNVMPGLHKGPGPTAYPGIWVFDAFYNQVAGMDPWRRVYDYCAAADTPEQIQMQTEAIRKALEELGYARDVGSVRSSGA